MAPLKCQQNLVDKRLFTDRDTFDLSRVIDADEDDTAIGIGKSNRHLDSFSVVLSPWVMSCVISEATVKLPYAFSVC